MFLLLENEMLAMDGSFINTGATNQRQSINFRLNTPKK
jgi:hypothetical protein